MPITLTPASGDSTDLDLVSVSADLAAINAPDFRDNLLRFHWDGSLLTVTVNTKPNMRVEVLKDGGGALFSVTT